MSEENMFNLEICFPKNPDPSKVAIQVQTPPLEGPRILRVLEFLGNDNFLKQHRYESTTSAFL